MSMANFVNRMVVLESSHLLMLHEFERIALQKVSLNKLNSSDLGVTTRIPKGTKIFANVLQNLTTKMF